MATYNKTTTSGKWAKASELGNVKRAAIVSETTPQASQFKDAQGNPKNQDVCKVKFEGMEEPLNVSLNRATINGLVDAFGSESKAWINKVLSVETEKIRVAGKSQIALYLIPEGYKKVDDENGFAVIIPDTGEEIKEVGAEDLPF